MSGRFCLIIFSKTFAQKTRIQIGLNMNFNELPTYKETDINKLKNSLSEFCEQYSISRFDPEDILELIEDGEDVKWVAGQLQQDNAELDIDKLTSLLTSIQTIVAPPKDDDEDEDKDEDEAVEVGIDTEAVASPMDLSQLDISQMGDQLEALTGMKLPPGMDMRQVKKMMEGPQGQLMADFAAWCQEQGIDIETMTDQQQIQKLNQQWMATPRPGFDGKTPAEMSQGDPSLIGMKKVETFRREEPKVGRNDPCPCGSGKKYKKCCGKGK